MQEMRVWSLAFLLAFVGGMSQGEESPPTPQSLPEATLPASSGGSASLAALRGKEATILVFLSTECPISNAYAPALNRLAKEFAARGVKIIGINTNSGASLREIEAHRQEYQLALDVYKDSGASVAARLGVQRCPEACLFDASGALRYRGRIDDRFARRGGAAGQVQRADLEEALREMLAGKPVSVPRTEAVGCPIEFPKRVGAETDSAVTYSRDIALLLARHCQECHRPGGVGPFALVEFDQAQRWAEDIREFTERKLMPPWRAEPGHGEFNNRRALSAEEIAKIAAWVEAGAPEGDRRELPPPRKFETTWKNGEPDLVLEMPEEYTIGPEGADEYRCFVVPTHQDEDRYVVALEVQPGNARVVHHVLVFMDNTGAAAKLDAAHEGPGYPVSGGSPGFFPLGGLGGWAPGNTAEKLPAGMAKVMPKGSHAVIQMHYHKTGKTETDRTRIGLFFAKGPVERPVYNIAVLPPEGPLGKLRIPAGENNFEVKTTMVMPRDFLLLAITPHMHLLGKDMQVTATLPDGTVQPLIYVKNWDFNWQETYQYQAPVPLSRGTRIDLAAHFDNSAKNPANPSRPPRDAKWGEQTFDEMCIAFLEVAPLEKARSKADLRNPTREERLFFILESRRLAGELTPATQAEFLQSLLKRFGEAPK